MLPTFRLRSFVPHRQPLEDDSFPSANQQMSVLKCSSRAAELIGKIPVRASELRGEEGEETRSMRSSPSPNQGTSTSVPGRSVGKAAKRSIDLGIPSRASELQKTLESPN